jgi:hypothetical protein
MKLILHCVKGWAVATLENTPDKAYITWRGCRFGHILGR